MSDIFRRISGAYKPVYNQEAFECIAVADGKIVERKVVPKINSKPVFMLIFNMF